MNLADLPDAHINPKLTMGENIADLGGILLGLDAYKLSVHAKTAEDLDGFSGEQRVFLGWAQVWRTVIRPEYQLQLLARDPHSPRYVRAFASLRNVDAWYEAFGIKEGDELYIAPEHRVRIW
ncbi:MAG: Neutral endopeptidase [bacterium ADurb.BinA186]|nr:MAG: Neutral endopeptidase [bacterium ADurb.BinA186]